MTAIDPAPSPDPLGAAAAAPTASTASATAHGCDRRRDALRITLLAAALACVVGFAFAPAGRFDFVSYDDTHYIYENPAVQRGLTLEGIRWAFTTGQAGNYHPLTWLSLMLDRSLWGAGPAGFHCTNIALHAANSLLLLLVLRALTGSTWRSAAVALIWAIHPLRVESVAWATERKDVLCGFFGLLTFAAYAHYAARPSWRRYAALLLSFELCLLSKSTWVTLPAVLLLLDVWPLRRLDPATVKPRLLEKLPLLALSLIACAATLVMQGHGAAIGALDQYPPLDRAANAVVSYATYPGNMVWPTRLAVFYPYRPVAGTRVVVAAFVLVAVTVIALRRRKAQPALLVGWLWFLGALVPMIGIVQSGAQARADRFTYLPMIGLLVGIAFALPAAWLASPRCRGFGGGVVALVAVALLAATRQQLGHWRNSTSLFERAIDVTRDNHVAHNSLGFEHLRAGRLDEARRHYEAAVRIKPAYGSALNGLGVVLARQGDRHGAIAQYRRALHSNPASALAHRNLGAQLLAMPGGGREGFEHLLRAVELKPDDARANDLLGVELARRGDVRAALTHFRVAAMQDPSDPQARLHLGRALVEAGRAAEGLEQLEQAIRHAPALAEAHFHAGAALARLGRLDEAAMRFRACLQLAPGDVDTLDALAQLDAHRQRAAAIDPAP